MAEASVNPTVFMEARALPNYFWNGILMEYTRRPVLATIVQRDKKPEEVLFTGLSFDWQNLIFVPVNGTPGDHFELPRALFDLESDRITWGPDYEKCTIYVDSLRVTEDQKHVELASETMKIHMRHAEDKTKAEAERAENMETIAETFEEGLRPIFGSSAAFRVRNDVFRENRDFDGELTAENIDHLISQLQTMKQQIANRPYGE